MYGSLLCQCKDSSTNYCFFEYKTKACFGCIECDGGKYGQNCSKACGFCSESQQCDTKNGTCKNGCSNGYIGDMCTKGDYQNIFFFFLVSR